VIINRFENQAALAKYAGLAWMQYQSGDFEAQKQDSSDLETDF
jgi:hypothetical protein